MSLNQLLSYKSLYLNFLFINGFDIQRSYPLKMAFNLSCLISIVYVMVNNEIFCPWFHSKLCVGCTSSLDEG